MNENQVMVIEYEERVTVIRHMRLELTHEEVLDFVGDVIGAGGEDSDTSIYLDPYELRDLIHTNPDMLDNAERDFSTQVLYEDEEPEEFIVDDVRLEDK
jgi:hypothetical protein